MDDVSLYRVTDKGQAGAEGLQGRGKTRWRCGKRRTVTTEPEYLQLLLLQFLSAKGTDLHRRQCSQLTG
jgi:hypothetical protein